MDQAGIRSLTSQLAEDLAWLEEHARSQPRQAAKAGELRLAAALVRNVVGPFLEGQSADPLHVAVVGGAGAGKSTVANFLSGAVLAESNPQAGFTRHPIAYRSANGQASWGTFLGFLGPLVRLQQEASASLDADVYQVRSVAAAAGASNVLEHFVVWDCPDMTTWAATGYVPRLLEICGLADVIVYVASDERYNDEVPTQFLKLLLQAGKAVVVCLVKMKEADAPAFVGHFQRDVLAKISASAIATLVIPQLTHEQLANPVEQASKYRIPLLNQVGVLGTPVQAARRRTVRSAMHFLKSGQELLLSVARDDLAALSAWRHLVQDGQIEFDSRYRREYLTSERFRRFDEALVKLLELLELPGVGKYVSGTLTVLRTPYRLLKGLFNMAVKRPDLAGLPERKVLEAGFGGWMDLLRKEATRREDANPLWQHVRKGFQSGFTAEARDKFEQGFRGFQLGLADEVERTARSIYEELERNPVALNTLRGTKFAMEVTAIGTALAAGGINVMDFIWVPLAASVTQHLVELLGKQYVENQREQTRARQQALVTQYLSGPLAQWLIQWPSTGGSAYERLQVSLRRIPEAIQQLDTAVEWTMRQTGG
jgi:hypothetical protein